MRWHKGSRYWRYGLPACVLSFALSVYLKDPVPWITTVPLFFGLAGYHNVKQIPK